MSEVKKADYRVEFEHWFHNRTVAGVDEAGRGPLAGPVVAAAVIISPQKALDIPRDSKKLTSKQRERYYEEITRDAISIGVGRVESEEIDRINILQASLLAMAIAVGRLSPAPELILVDGNKRIPTEIEQKTIVGGDGISASIAAASIIAKVERDRIMVHLDEQFPLYNFRQHKGYPTREHIEKLRLHGPTPIHRKTFKWVR